MSSLILLCLTFHPMMRFQLKFLIAVKHKDKKGTCDELSKKFNECVNHHNGDLKDFVDRII